MAYGTQADRLRAAAMAKLAGKSTSAWLLSLIRESYGAVYGDTPPEKLDVSRDQHSAP